MSRKGDWEIKKWMDRDIKVAQLFNCVCNVSKEDAIRYCGISENRLNTLDNMHYIEKKVDNRGNFYYRTTKEGRDVFEEKTGIRGYISNSYKHDKILYDVFVSLSDDEQRSWLTEHEQRQIAEDNGYDLSEVSICDGAYMNSNGDMVYVEVVTSDYTEKMIEKKIEYVNMIGGIYDEHRI